MVFEILLESFSGHCDVDVYIFFHTQFIGQSIVIQNSLGAILGNRNRKLEEIAVSQKSRIKYSYIKF